MSRWLDSTVPESTCLLMQHSPTTPQEKEEKRKERDREKKEKDENMDRKNRGKERKQWMSKKVWKTTDTREKKKKGTLLKVG